MRSKDIHQFDTRSFRATVDTMRARGEDVHATGRAYKEKTGGLHPNVDIVGKIPRVSRNAMIPGKEPGTGVLVHGISLPVFSLFDGTGSTARWVTDFFHAAERQYKLLDGVRTRYNPQQASGVVQDVYNVHNDGLPVVQVSQFESDERSAEQVRLLQPASMGNNTTAEDYELGLYYGLLIDADIWSFYDLKGYMTLAADDIGKNGVTLENVNTYLGQSLDGSKLDSRQICQMLQDHWHFFLLQVPNGQGRLLPYATEWWTDKVGRSRIIQVPEPSLLAEVRAALIYVTEATHPTRQGLIEFFQGDGPDHVAIDMASLENIWRWVQPAEVHFGAQAKLPGYHDIPRPGDVFAHYRHAWPIDHPRASENITPSESS